MCRLLTTAQPTLVRAARSGKAAAVRVAAVQVLAVLNHSSINVVSNIQLASIPF